MKKKGKSQRTKSEQQKVNKPVVSAKIIPENVNAIPENQVKPPESNYSFTKHGDRLGIGVALFFWLMFFMPGCSVILTSGEVTGGLICIGLSVLPIRYVIRQWYSLKTEIKNDTVYYTERRAFKPEFSWSEPLAYYSGVFVESNDDNEEAVLRHSSDDSKNVVLASEFRGYDEVEEKAEKLNKDLKSKGLGTKIRELQIKKPEGYAEINFFEIYNKGKAQKRPIFSLLFPDRHLKILQDENGVVFTAGINRNIILFYIGMVLLGFSFLLLPFAFISFSTGVIACLCHLAGVLLYNFGQAEHVIKAEKRSLVIGQRWLKRRLVIQEVIPFADIVSAEVIKNLQEGTINGELFTLKINAGNKNYFFGNSVYNEELSWLCGAITDRIMRINLTQDKRIDL